MLYEKCSIEIGIRHAGMVAFLLIVLILLIVLLCPSLFAVIYDAHLEASFSFCDVDLLQFEAL